MESMTGFGNSSEVVDSYSVTVLAKSVNNKGVSISFRAPREVAHLEQGIHRRIRELFLRGRIDVNISIENTGEGALPEPDINLARAYLSGADKLAKEFYLTSSPDAFRLVTLSGIMRAPDSVSGDDFDAGINKVCEAALQKLLSSRREEGRGLEKTFRAGLSRIGELAGPVYQQHSQRVNDLFLERKKRVEELLGEPAPAIDTGRMSQELALLSDRIDISEEHQRLTAHVGSALQILTDNGSGRKLGFILQEIHRELNTMGAKVDCSEAVHRVIEMKDILGGLREQVANVQ